MDEPLSASKNRKRLQQAGLSIKNRLPTRRAATFASLPAPFAPLGAPREMRINFSEPNIAQSNVRLRSTSAPAGNPKLFPYIGVQHPSPTGIPLPLRKTSLENFRAISRDPPQVPPLPTSSPLLMPVPTVSGVTIPSSKPTFGASCSTSKPASPTSKPSSTVRMPSSSRVRARQRAYTFSQTTRVQSPLSQPPLTFEPETPPTPRPLPLPPLLPPPSCPLPLPPGAEAPHAPDSTLRHRQRSYSLSHPQKDLPPPVLLAQNPSAIAIEKDLPVPQLEKDLLSPISYLEKDLPSPPIEPESCQFSGGRPPDEKDGICHLQAVVHAQAFPDFRVPGHHDGHATERLRAQVEGMVNLYDDFVPDHGLDGKDPEEELISPLPDSDDGQDFHDEMSWVNVPVPSLDGHEYENPPTAKKATIMAKTQLLTDNLGSRVKSITNLRKRLSTDMKKIPGDSTTRLRSKLSLSRPGKNVSDKHCKSPSSEHEREVNNETAQYHPFHQPLKACASLPGHQVNTSGEERRQPKPQSLRPFHSAPANPSDNRKSYTSLAYLRSEDDASSHGDAGSSRRTRHSSQFFAGSSPLRAAVRRWGEPPPCSPERSQPALDSRPLSLQLPDPHGPSPVRHLRSVSTDSFCNPEATPPRPPAWFRTEESGRNLRPPPSPTGNRSRLGSLYATTTAAADCSMGSPLGMIRFVPETPSPDAVQRKSSSRRLPQYESPSPTRHHKPDYREPSNRVATPGEHGPPSAFARHKRVTSRDTMISVASDDSSNSAQAADMTITPPSGRRRSVQRSPRLSRLSSSSNTPPALTWVTADEIMAGRHQRNASSDTFRSLQSEYSVYSLYQLPPLPSSTENSDEGHCGGNGGEGCKEHVEAEGSNGHGKGNDEGSMVTQPSAPFPRDNHHESASPSPATQATEAGSPTSPRRKPRPAPIPLDVFTESPVRKRPAEQNSPVLPPSLYPYLQSREHPHPPNISLPPHISLPSGDSYHHSAPSPRPVPLSAISPALSPSPGQFATVTRVQPDEALPVSGKRPGNLSWAQILPQKILIHVPVDMVSSFLALFPTTSDLSRKMALVAIGAVLQRSWNPNTPSTEWRHALLYCAKFSLPPSVIHPENRCPVKKRKQKWKCDHAMGSEIAKAEELWAETTPNRYEPTKVFVFDHGGEFHKFPKVHLDLHYCRQQHQSDVDFVCQSLLALHRSLVKDGAHGCHEDIENIVTSTPFMDMWRLMHATQPPPELHLTIRLLSHVFCLCRPSITLPFPTRALCEVVLPLPQVNLDGTVAWEDVWLIMRIVVPLARDVAKKGLFVGDVNRAFEQTTIPRPLPTYSVDHSGPGVWDWIDIRGLWHIGLVRSQSPTGPPLLESWDWTNLVPCTREQADSFLFHKQDRHARRQVPEHPPCTLDTGLPWSTALPPVYFQGLTVPGRAARPRYYLRGVARLTTDQPPEVRFKVVFRNTTACIDELVFEGIQPGGCGSPRGVVGVAFLNKEIEPLDELDDAKLSSPPRNSKSVEVYPCWLLKLGAE